MAANVAKSVVQLFEFTTHSYGKKNIWKWKTLETLEIIPKKLCYTYLGVIIDNELIWDDHAKKIMQNASFAVWKLRKYLCGGNISIRARLNVFRSLICPIFSYVCAIWRPSDKVWNAMCRKYGNFLKSVVGISHNSLACVLQN